MESLGEKEIRRGRVTDRRHSQNKVFAMQQNVVCGWKSLKLHIKFAKFSVRREGERDCMGELGRVGHKGRVIARRHSQNKLFAM